ncbi:Ppx/GppA phosphatase family protein [Cumulibacter soli]|uniref:Ppx/GppA phosphatase family protein n=1 Tax=Cumulibacter soli TaxID=2546344 RepID=UPI00106896F5|nr:Ppx/GppA phosphatase family protein [Cumulibacter soli]
MGGVRRVAAIDCGTNTLRLLIADVAPGTDRRVRQVLREMRTVRLGEGIDATGRFADAALRRTEATLREYAHLIADHEVAATRMVATSASRDAANREELIDLVNATVGVTPEVISGDQEGRLTFAGVLSGFELTEESIVIDIGGGSTELFIGDAAGVDQGISMNIGVVRLSERHVHSDPPLPAELALVADDVHRALADGLAQIPPLPHARVIAVAGTATTAAAIAHQLPGYDPSVIHGLRTSSAELRRVYDWASARDTAQRAAHPAMHPGRAGVFPAGMVILDSLLRELGADEMTVSESDILDGIALSIADGE